MFLKKITLVLITLLVLVTGISFEVDAQNKRTELNNQLKSITAEIDNAKKEFNNLESQKKDLKDQIESVKQEIRRAEGLIVATEVVIKDITSQIPITEAKIKQLQEQMYHLYKEIQVNSVSSKIEILFKSKNFSELVSKLYGMSAIQEEAERIQGELKESLILLQEQKKAQEDLLKKQKENKFLLIAKNSSLDRLVAETQNKQEEYDKKINEQRNLEKKVQTEIANLPKPIQNYIYNNGGNTQVKGSESGPCYFFETRKLDYPKDYFILPTQGAWTDNVNCYPWSWSWRRNGHDGMDIANAYGTPIYATANGVAVRNYPDFGNSIVLKHTLPSGQVVYSMYGHMNKPAFVRIGQTVKQGDLIGEIGSTGFSTGPHLHFMIISDTFEDFGPYCAYGNRQAKCYDPAKILGM